MSEDTPTATTESPPDKQSSTDSDIAQKMVTYAQWAMFALLVIVAVMATVRLYFAASAAIETFITRRYRPLFMAGFNVAVLLGCGLGLSALLRRLA